MIEHKYQNIEGWFNMESQYLDLIQLTPDNGTFIELGAYRGKSTCFAVTEIINQNRKIKFYTVDMFKGISELSDSKEIDAYNKVNISDIYIDFTKNTEHIKNKFEVIISMSDIAASKFSNNSVDTIFIDAGHSYEAVFNDLKAWYPKMKNGSIMSGHDFGNYDGVAQAFRQFFKQEPNKVENACWFMKIIK